MEEPNVRSLPFGTQTTRGGGGGGRTEGRREVILTRRRHEGDGRDDVDERDAAAGRDEAGGGPPRGPAAGAAVPAHGHRDLELEAPAAVARRGRALHPCGAPEEEERRWRRSQQLSWCGLRSAAAGAAGKQRPGGRGSFECTGRLAFLMMISSFVTSFNGCFGCSHRDRDVRMVTWRPGRLPRGPPVGPGEARSSRE